ncbi:MAG TPA: hypothetical protein VLT62_24055 [Candidatus Methylomirabilis sp.]|nr:hypothetical protein [Candidatus Methylomirabilis sp.]
MQSRMRLMALLAAGSLALAAGVAVAATSESTESSKKPEASKTSATPASTESKKMQARPAGKEQETAADRSARGIVTAVEPSANPATLTIKAMRGKQEETVGVDVPASAKIHEGKAAKTLADIKVGDRVWMKYDRTSDKLVADSIRILKPAGKTSARKGSGEYGKATPAASKTDNSK